MEKRVVVALVLALAVIFLYQQFVVRWIAPLPAKNTISNNETIDQSKQLNKDEGQGNTAPSLIGREEPADIPSQVAEETVVLETPLYKAVFSNKGGGIKSFVLKQHRESLEQSADNVEMVAPNLEEYPLQDKLIKNNISETIYFTPSTSNLSLNSDQKDEITFTRELDGIRIEKRYTFQANTYAIHVETTVFNISADVFNDQLSTGLVTSVPFIQKRGDSKYHKGQILYVDGKVLTKEIKEGEETLTGIILWSGIEDMYFISAIIPEKIENIKWSTATSKDLIKTNTTVPLQVKPGDNTSIKYTAYIGPKEMDRMNNLGVHLEDSISLGWFSFLAKPLFVVLNFFYTFIPNYGLVIILITIIIKILFHPLTKKGLDSMKEMQAVQPQIVALREKYKDDKEKMNRELMDLYKRYKINPLGGCLPMILQIPVFIALYNVLSASIELRHSPFAFWIHDLSAKDPYYITPIIMGATMLIQQKMTPSTMDPAQAKMMLIMPVVFTFMFLSFPSGLVLYWLVNNVLSIAQQYYIQKAKK